MRANRLNAGILPVVVAVAAALGLAGCAAEANQQAAPARAERDAADFRILPDPAFGESAVPVVRPVELTVTGGKLRAVRLSNPQGERVAGKLSDDGTRWLATEPLAYGTRYTWRGSAVDADGERYPIDGTFRTLKPTRVVTTSANVADGGVYPEDLRITLTFSDPVDDKKAVERALKVSTTPRTAGRWRWSADDLVADWRPDERWQPGTRIQLSGKLYGLRLGAGHYGAADTHLGLSIIGG